MMAVWRRERWARNGGSKAVGVGKAAMAAVGMSSVRSGPHTVSIFLKFIQNWLNFKNS
jgi:hypothetical protein